MPVQKRALDPFVLQAAVRQAHRSQRPWNHPAWRGCLELRAAEPVALHQLDAKVAQAAHLITGFDPFGDHLDAQLTTHREYARDNRTARNAGVDTAHQRHVQFDDVGLEVRQQKA